MNPLRDGIGISIFLAGILGTLYFAPFGEIAGEKSQALDCADLLRAANHGYSSDERSFSTLALSDCPTTPQIQSLLEANLRTEDIQGRAAAWNAISFHLRMSSLQSMVESMDYAGKRVLAYSYFLRLAKANPKEENRTRLIALFQKGLHDDDKLIRLNSIVGLGQLKSAQDLPAIRKLFTKAEDELLDALLDSAALYESESFYDSIERTLNHENVSIQIKAIHALEKTPGYDSLERLLLMGSRHQPLESIQMALKNALSARSKEFDKRGAPFVATQPLSFYQSPDESSNIEFVLEKETIILAESHIPKQYLYSNQAADGIWFKAITLDGEKSGFIHTSQIRAINYK